MLKIGIIGAGSIGGHHEKGISELDDCRITAVCDIRLDAAREMAERHGAAVFENYQDLLKTDVDIVYVCTPPYLHKEMAVASAEAGKHIFLEKPMALSYKDCLAIKEAVNRAGVKCQLGYVVGFRPAEDTARRVFKEGRVGSLVSVWDKRLSNASFLTDAIGTYRDWLIDKDRSGGVLIECMTHEVAWLMSIGGEVDSVYANIQYTNPDPRINVDDNCWAMFNFKNGGVGILGTSWSNPIGGAEKGILGVEGAIQIMPNSIVVGSRKEGSKEEIPGVPDENLSKQGYFNKCIKENLSPRNSIDDALNNMKVMLAMHESSQKNKVVKVDEIEI
jgi:predicted dehydrogenase